MAEVALDAVNVIAELDRMGWAWEPTGDGEVKVRCPVHQDETPSCSINDEKRLFQCHTAGCGARGDFISFMAFALNAARRVIIEELSTRYSFETTRTVDPETVEKHHQRIWNSGPLLLELRKRGVTDEDIRKYRIGFDGKRITIPIRNETGLFVNERRYLPGAPGSEKMRNLRGHGELRLFPLEQLKYDVVVVLGGELKAVVGARHLNPHEIGCITATGGEGNWEREFSTKLRGKKVYVMLDVDDEGQEAADVVCARISAEAGWVGNAQLEIDRDKYPHGDINDYFGQEGGTAESLLDMLDRTPQWEPKSIVPPMAVGEAESTHLSLVTEPGRAGKRVRVRAVVTSRDDAPYHVPRVVQCVCDRNQPFCSSCPIFARSEDQKGGVTATVPSDAPALLGMIEAPKKAQRDALRDGLRIPPCKSVSFRTLEHYSVEDVRLTPQLELSSTGMDNVQRSAYYVGHGLESNASYEFVGRVHPAPKDQRAVLLASEAIPTEDSLTSFNPTDIELEQLHLFKPAGWTVAGIEEKLTALYADFSANVTGIYKRADMHLAVDLSYHSPLVIHFDKREVKGWVEVLIVGDSGQGKTETTEQMMKHYGVGIRHVCKKVSTAGLMGGATQVGSRWFVSWGVIPTHDRRLVILEELKGASTEVLSKLTDMRSSGIAEISLIERRKTHARTRLVCVSNPRAEKPISQHSFGVEAVKELIGSLEDIRRFDFAYVVSQEDVEASEINVLASMRTPVPHEHTAELCKRLVHWAWTRTPGQVIFDDEAVKSIVAGAIALCERYSDVLPLVDRGSIRHKLARMSASLAARTYSSANQDPRKLVVRPCHADYVISMLDRHYSSKACGYFDYSRAVRASEQLLEADTVKKRVLEVPFLRDFIHAMLHSTDIEMRDIQDWCGWDFDQARELLGFLVRKHALLRVGNAYQKTSQFISLLKSMQDSDEVKSHERPDYLRDERRQF